MKRYKCVVSYDGTRFAGYQVQPNKVTVQSEIERALTKLHKGSEVGITASGRTDAGVHARGQVIHFDSPLSIPLPKWNVAINSLLPDDIVIKSVEEANTAFHARFDAIGKEYRYFVQRSEKRDPFTRNYAYHNPYPLNIDEMERAANYLIGTHDFTSFCSAKTEVTNKVRHISEIDMIEDGEQLVFRFVGNGFLYNMVRILVGTLLEVGSGARTADSISETIAQKDRAFAGKTAPANGLYLWEVFY